MPSPSVAILKPRPEVIPAEDPFLMAVAIGAACDFLTPIGHQSNLLVMGPGGYSFGTIGGSVFRSQSSSFSPASP